MMFLCSFVVETKEMQQSVIVAISAVSHTRFVLYFEKIVEGGGSFIVL